MKQHYHWTIVAILLLFFTPCTYAASPAFDLEASILLREAVKASDPQKVRNALTNHADPNYTPTPLSPTVIQRSLKLCWYTSTSEVRRACCLLPIAVIFELGGIRQNTHLAPFQEGLLWYLGFMMVRSVLSNSNNTADTSPSLDKSPLLLATLKPDSRKQRAIVRMLLDAKADLHATDAQGNTALHYAMKQDLFITELKRLLICAGADFDSHNNYCVTPRSLMQEKSNQASNQSFFRYFNKSKQNVDDHIGYLTALLKPLPPLFNETHITRIIGDYCLPSEEEFYTDEHTLDSTEQWAVAYRMHNDPESPLAPAQQPSSRVR